MGMVHSRTHCVSRAAQTFLITVKILAFLSKLSDATVHAGLRLMLPLIIVHVDMTSVAGTQRIIRTGGATVGRVGASMLCVKKVSGILSEALSLLLWTESAQRVLDRMDQASERRLYDIRLLYHADETYATLRIWIWCWY